MSNKCRPSVVLNFFHKPLRNYKTAIPTCNFFSCNSDVYHGQAACFDNAILQEQIDFSYNFYIGIWYSTFALNFENKVPYVSSVWGLWKSLGLHQRQKSSLFEKLFWNGMSGITPKWVKICKVIPKNSQISCLVVT